MDVTETKVVNPWLEGNFAPVASEVTAFDLPVEGALPVELEGRFLRNGRTAGCSAGRSRPR
jgi:carotenoid cleavage dioxygenase